MSNEQKTSGSPLPGILIGIVIMVLGGWMEFNVHLGFVDKLNEQGIPVDPGKTVAAIGVLLILFPVLKYFYVNPLREAIENRTSELERTFTEAEELRARMTSMRTEYEQRLVATEASAREQIQTEIRKAQDLRKQIEEDAKANADAWLDAARRDFEAEKAKMVTELRVEVVNLALLAAEKLVHQSMSSDLNRKLVQEFVEKAEVSN